MKNYQKEIIKETAKEVLLRIFDLATPFFEASSIYRTSTKEYLNHRSVERSDFMQKIQYLRRHGLIETFVENKESYIKLTTKGIQRIENILEDSFEIARPLTWDRKWRVVIFDIPDKKKIFRNMFRGKLLKLGFIKIQGSVYVFPFDCAEVIAKISEKYSIDQDVLIMISDIIQGEETIIEQFMDHKILTAEDVTSSI